MRHWCSAVFVPAAILVGFTPQWDMVPAQKPAAVEVASSASGEWNLSAVQLDDTGSSANTYELLAGSRLAAIWKHDFGFVLDGAVVTDSGVVAAFGYTRGKNPRHDDLGAFVVEIVDRDGAVRHKTSISRSSMRVADSGYFPFVKGHVFCTFGGAREILILRMSEPFLRAGSGAEAWWFYDLERGEFGGSASVTTREAQDDGRFVNLVSVTAVQREPIVAVLWRRGRRSDYPDGAGDLVVLYDVRSLQTRDVVWSAQPTSGAPADSPTAVRRIESAEPSSFRLRLGKDEVLSWKIVPAANASWTAQRQ